MRALVRRSTGNPQPAISIGPVHLDPRTRQVTVNGVPVGLTPLEFRLLNYLLHHRGRSRDENRVSICDRLAQRGDCRRRRLDVVLLVVGWHGLEALVELELHVGGQKLLRRAEELRVVRIPAQTARDREDLHPAYASLTK